MLLFAYLVISASFSAQNITVSGLVADETDDGAPVTTILIKGTVAGTTLMQTDTIPCLPYLISSW